MEEQQRRRAEQDAAATAAARGERQLRSSTRMGTGAAPTGGMGDQAPPQW